MRKETVGWEINKRLYLPTALSKSACVPHTQTNVLSGSSAHVMGLSDFKPADETRGGQENVVSGLQCVFCCSFAAVNWQQPSIVGLRSFPVVSSHKISGLLAFKASPAVFFGNNVSFGLSNHNTFVQHFLFRYVQSICLLCETTNKTNGVCR